MKNKTALITGAGTGIGKAAALKLASQGTNVIVSDYRSEGSEQVIADISAAATNGASVRFVQNDVRSDDAVQKMVSDIVSEFERLDFAVNNAGICSESGVPLDASDLEKFRLMVDTNIVGTYNCMKHEIAAMKKTGGGSIVNLASITGLNGAPGSAGYSSTKHAIVGLTKTSALDHALDGIRVNAVAPGGITTDMAKQSANDVGITLDDIAGIHPMSRMGTVKEVADGIAWLLSDEASFVTGHILNIDGGFQAK